MFRPLAKDGVNRSLAAIYAGQHSPAAALDAADRLHLILQREDALVAKNSGVLSKRHCYLVPLLLGWLLCMPKPIFGPNY